MLGQAYAGQSRFVEAITELEEVLTFDSLDGSVGINSAASVSAYLELRAEGSPREGTPNKAEGKREVLMSAPRDLIDDTIELIARLKRLQAHARRQSPA